jgi:hypothetical protein
MAGKNLQMTDFTFMHFSYFWPEISQKEKEIIILTHVSSTLSLSRTRTRSPFITTHHNL